MMSRGKEPGASQLKSRLASPSLSRSDLDALARDFTSAAKDGTHADAGWPNSAYGVSKILLSALSRIQQREFDTDSGRKDLVVNHLHPGYVDTDMTSHRGPLTVDEGSRASIYAALLPAGTELRGKYIWEDCTLKDWVNGE